MAAPFRRKLLECYVLSMNKLSRSTPLPPDPRSIFVMQPGHIGDLLVNTPLFEALKRKYPAAHITVAAGPWNGPTVENNPHVTEFVPLGFPWDNKFVHPQGLVAAMKFIYRSPEVRALAARRFEIGIDLPGTQFDVLLMMKMGIGYRIGIRGQHGYTAMHQTVRQDYGVRMGTKALQLGRLLGATDQVPTRPQIFLTELERSEGEALWSANAQPRPVRKQRLVIAPAAGMPLRSWPHENYIEAVQELSRDEHLDIVLVGGEDAAELCGRISAAAPSVRNQCCKLALRQTFSLISAADLTLSNPNMVMHVAASFSVPSIVVLAHCTVLARANEQRLWGHETSRFFGNEIDHAGIYTPPEIVAIIRDALDRPTRSRF